MGIRKAQGQKRRRTGQVPQGGPRSGWEQRARARALGPVEGNSQIRPPLLLFLAHSLQLKHGENQSQPGTSVGVAAREGAGRLALEGTRASAAGPDRALPRAAPAQGPERPVPPRLHSAPARPRRRRATCWDIHPVSEPTGASLGLWKHGPPKPVGVTPTQGAVGKETLLAHRQGVPGSRPMSAFRPSRALPLHTRSSPAEGRARTSHATSEEAAAQGADGLPALCTFSSK